MARLDDDHFDPLLEALRDAFPRRPKLDMMLKRKFRKALDDLTHQGTFEEQLYQLIETAQSEGWTTELVIGGRQSNPGNEKLRDFAQTVGVTVPTGSAQTASPVISDVDLDMPSQELESIIQEAYGFLDLPHWIAQSQQIMGQVCKIAIQTNKGFLNGTGFLVGPDLVLTNYHVVEPVIQGEEGRLTREGVRALSQDVTLHFDYAAQGQTSAPVSRVKLMAESWLLDSSPVEDLDYAVLRLAERPGDKRGWIAIPDQESALSAQMPLFIVQHPGGDTIKLALDKVLQEPWPPNRVRYTTNTQPGSSGSPCFKANWELVALHHLGDRSQPPTYNQGIPIAAIAKRWKQKGIWEELVQIAPLVQGGSLPPQKEPLTSEGATEFATHPPDATQTPSPDVQALIEGLNRHKLLNILLKLNDDRFRKLVAILGMIDYDHLGGDNTGRKTLELVLWAERHNHFPELIQVAHDLYPDLGWKV